MASQPEIGPLSSGPSSSAAGASTSSAPIPLTPAQQAMHEIQRRYKLSSPTFNTLATIIKAPSRADALRKACWATELRLFPIRHAEKAFLREINEHTAIPYRITGEPTEPWQKAFLIVQINLLGTGWPNKLSKIARQDLLADCGRMYTILDQALRCIVDILGERKDGTGVNNALDVLRSLRAGVWEGSENQLLQVDGIGPAMMGKLVKAGINTIRQLSQQEFYTIERILSRKPPFGHDMIRTLKGFPVLTLILKSIEIYPTEVNQAPPGTVQPSQIFQGPTQPTARQMWAVGAVLGFQNERIPHWKRNSPWVTLVVEGEDGRLVWFWRGNLKSLEGGKEMIMGWNARKGEVLKISFACEEIVGTIYRDSLLI